MGPSVVIVFSALIALVCSILIWCLVMPEKKRPTLNKFFAFVSDVFNFRSLLLEKILKFTYLFLTLVAIFAGFFMLFYASDGARMIVMGLAIMLFGPIILRLLYELVMMAVLLVKNVIDINNKLPLPTEEKKNVEPKVEAFVPPVAETVPPTDAE